MTAHPRVGYPCLLASFCCLVYWLFPGCCLLVLIKKQIALKRQFAEDTICKRKTNAGHWKMAMAEELKVKCWPDVQINLTPPCLPSPPLLISYQLNFSKKNRDFNSLHLQFFFVNLFSLISSFSASGRAVVSLKCCRSN